MEVTYKTKGIVLRREPYNENDSRVFVYTRDFGKLDLIARGTQKLSSKLVSHIEPLNLCEIMVVRGKQYDYLGTIISEEVFAGVKDDYDKTVTAGEILKLVNDAVKEKQAEPEIFLLLQEFFKILNNGHILKSAFILKFLALLGYAPELDKCVVCSRQLQPGGNSFSYAAGGVVCGGCRQGEPLLSDGAINTIRLILTAPLGIAAHTTVNENLAAEVISVTHGMRLYSLT